MRRWFHLIATMPLVVWLAGCAHVIVDTDGTRHVTGFVSITLPPPDREVGADAIRVRAIGLAVSSGPALGTQVNIGYSDTTIAALRNDSAVSRTEIRRLAGELPREK